LEGVIGMKQDFSIKVLKTYQPRVAPQLLSIGLVLILSSCPGQQPNPIPDPIPTSCVISAPPSALNLDPFYTKYCSLRGIPLISAAVVPDVALNQAWKTLDKMLSGVSSGVVQKMIANKTRIGILGVNQLTTQMPEYKNLDKEFPLPNAESWDARARGLGATPYIPLSSGAEENILCYPSDRYKGEDILLHEFAHTVLIMGVEFSDTNFKNRLTSAYSTAKGKGLWANTYADDTVNEYWAEGVQDYYNTNIESIPSNGIHNEINTRAELKNYDPALFGLITEIFGTQEWTSTCP
jgi:hypothetical protein